MNTEQQSSNKLSFEECLREEFLVNTQNYPKEYHQLFNTKFNRAKRRFDDVSNTINEPIELIDDSLMWSIVKEAARELYYIHNDKTYPDTEVYIQDKILRSFEKDLHHVYPFVFDKIKNSLHKKSEPIKDEQLKKEAKSLYLDNYNDYPMVNADESFMDGIELGCWGMNRKYSKQYATSQVNNTVEDKWISVEKELPRIDGRSTVYCLVLDSKLGIVVRPFNEYHNCWDEEDADDFYTPDKGGNITHWQPLPKPPIK